MATMASTDVSDHAHNTNVSNPQHEPHGTADETTSHGGIENDQQDGSSHTDGQHSDDSSLVDHVHEKQPAAAKLTKREKLKRHCSKYWWWHLIAAIILLAILLPIIFTLIVPAIVQAIVNKQSLPVYGGAFKALSPEALLVSLNTSLNTPLGVTTDPLTLSLAMDARMADWPFTNFTLNKMYIKGKTYAILNEQRTPVRNDSQLTEWVGRLFDQENVTLYVQGNPSVHLGALHSVPHLRKTVEIPALNKLEGKSIENLELMLDHDADGNNLQGTLNLPNNGVLALDFGDLSLNLFSGPLKLGNVTLKNVNLVPGPNPIPFKGILDLKVLLQNLGTVLNSQAQALGKGNIDLNATATSVTVNGVHIPYVEDVLKARTLTFSINVVTLLADVLSSLVHGSKKSLGDLVNDIIGNKTLIQEVNSHWNSSEALEIGANKMKRLASREALTWEMLKLSMKMNRNRF